MAPLTAESLSQVQRQDVRWLWRPFIPHAKLTLLDGDPGVGKSFLTADLAARLSRGTPLPDGTPSDRPHTILLLNAEDSAADTTRPRAEAAGADLDRVRIVSAGDDQPRLPACVPDLEHLIRHHRADLLVIDPLMAFLPPTISANIDQCVRTVLTPLARLAERTDCGILLVRHLRKKADTPALRRGQGSMGIMGAARTALLAGPHPTDPTLTVLALSKSNLTDERSAFGYRLVPGTAGQPGVEWVGRVEVRADAVGEKSAGLKPRDRAMAWLHAELRNGPRPAMELYVAAAATGIPEMTLRRAKRALRVASEKVQRDGRGVWYWYDPDAPWPADSPIPKPFELPPITDLPPLGE